MHKNKNKPSENKGFTLIELLVVISIIGLLSSIVLASLNTARGKANDAKTLAEKRQIIAALELYANDHGGGYPNPDYNASGGPTKFRKPYCVGATDCVLNHTAVTTMLPGIQIGTISNPPSVSISSGSVKGIIYLACQQNTPTCSPTQNFSNSALLISATNAKGVSEQQVGTWTTLYYTPPQDTGTTP